MPAKSSAAKRPARPRVNRNPSITAADAAPSIDVSHHRQVLITSPAGSTVLIVNDRAGDDERPAPTNVIEALARVLADLGGIRKMTPRERAAKGLAPEPGERAVTYAYRGIDQVASALQPLLGRYTCVIVPTAIQSTVTDIQQSNPPKPWTATYVFVNWTIYGPGGVTDTIPAVSEGLGYDNSDKGFNKAITMAHKNLVLRLFSIGDPADDPDAEKHDSSGNAPHPGEGRQPGESRTDAELEFRKLVAELDRGTRMYFVADFFAEFDATMAELEPDYHADALEWARRWWDDNIGQDGPPQKQVETGPGHVEPLPDAAAALADAAEAMGQPAGTGPAAGTDEDETESPADRDEREGVTE